MHRLNKFKKEDEEIGTITNEVNTLINTTIDSTRRISHDLLPPTLEDFGLVEAIKELKESLHQTEDVSIVFDFQNAEEKITDKLVELNLFRILQELISNSIRHGKATVINIRIGIQKSAIKLEYSDNGAGFEIANVKKKKGLGMKNIESRLNMIKATYDLDTAPGNGVKVTIEV